MMGRPSNFLGLAFSDRGIACAEVSVSGDKRQVRHTATFVFTADVSLEKPEAAGQALAAFLREKRFGASRCVAGVPARWLLASEREIPPANETQARAALQMQAERVSAADSGDIVFDYAGKPSSQGPTRVLLVGIIRTQFDKVQRCLDAAGLTIEAITSTALAFAGNLSKAENEAAMLLIGASGAEMVLRSGGGVRALRHVSVSANGHGLAAVSLLGSELRRTVAMSNGTSTEMLLLDGVGLPPEQVAELSNRAGMQMRAGNEMKLLGMNADALSLARLPSDEAQPAGYFAPAVSLAISGARPDALSLDFSHSRLAPAPVRRISRNAAIGIVVGVILIGYIISLYVQVSRRQSDLDSMKSQIDGLSNQLTQAQVVVDHVNFASTYFEARPPVLECLRQITLTFHDDEKIWVTTFNLKDNGKGQLVGKSVDQATVLTLIDRLKKNSKFSEVKLSDVHEADTRTHEWAYSLSFTYNFGV